MSFVIDVTTNTVAFETLRKMATYVKRKYRVPDAETLFPYMEQEFDIKIAVEHPDIHKLESRMFVDFKTEVYYTYCILCYYETTLSTQ